MTLTSVSSVGCTGHSLKPCGKGATAKVPLPLKCAVLRCLHEVRPQAGEAVGMSGDDEASGIADADVAQGKPEGAFLSTIEDVDFFAMFTLWKNLKTKNKLLFLPGDLEDDKVTIVYKPAYNCVIEITSEPAGRMNKSYLKGIYINCN